MVPRCCLCLHPSPYPRVLACVHLPSDACTIQACAHLPADACTPQAKERYAEVASILGLGGNTADEKVRGRSRLCASTSLTDVVSKDDLVCKHDLVQ